MPRPSRRAPGSAQLALELFEPPAPLPAAPSLAPASAPAHAAGAEPRLEGPPGAAKAGPAASPRRSLALLVHRRLCDEYGVETEFFRTLDPLSELIGSMLSHRTKNADSAAAYRSLRARFATWREVIEAPVAEVAEAVARSTWPERKAPALQRVLAAIEARTGELSLSCLESMSDREAREWLLSLPGVGPKTTESVLLFSTLRRAAMPVDCHHHRVAERVGLIPRGTAPGPSHELLRALLPPSWGPGELLAHHVALMTHGKRRCFHSAPACRGCPLLDLCESAPRSAQR